MILYDAGPDDVNGRGIHLRSNNSGFEFRHRAWMFVLVFVYVHVVRNLDCKTTREEKLIKRSLCLANKQGDLHNFLHILIDLIHHSSKL